MENSATPTRVSQLHRCFPLAVQPPTLLLNRAQTQIAPNRPDPPPPKKAISRPPRAATTLATRRQSNTPPSG